MTGCEDFFADKATVFVGDTAGAEDVAVRVMKGLAIAGLRHEEVPCLQDEHVSVYHRGALYMTQGDLDRFVRYAREMRAVQGVTARPPVRPPSVSTKDRLELRDQGHAASSLPPLVGRRFRLATRGGLLVLGNWWLESIGAETFELASEFGLAPPIGAAPRFGFPSAPPEHDHVIIEVWPTDTYGTRMDCVRGKPHTTMVHLPFTGPHGAGHEYC